MSILRDLSLYMSTYNFSFNQVVIINMISDLKHFQERDDLKLDECLCAPLNANFCQSGRSFHLVLDLQFPFIFPSQIFLLSLQWLPLKVEAVWAPFETKKKKKGCLICRVNAVIQALQLQRYPFCAGSTYSGLFLMESKTASLSHAFLSLHTDFFFLIQLIGLSQFCITLSLPNSATVKYIYIF